MKQHVLLRVLSAEADRDALRPILDALKEKGLSKGEFQSVMQAVGGLEAMIDSEHKDKDLLAALGV